VFALSAAPRAPATTPPTARVAVPVTPPTVRRGLATTSPTTRVAVPVTPPTLPRVAAGKADRTGGGAVTALGARTDGEEIALAAGVER
jgi:hypothetical protein